MLLALALLTQDALAPAELRALPVREVTVFKDGHALLLREGALATDKEGVVTLDGLPAPVLGTFWAYSAEPDAPLASVVASRRKVRVERDPADLNEALEARGPGEAFIRETGGERYWAHILSASPTLLRLKTPDGYRALPRDRVLDVTFKEPGPAKLAREELKDVLRLRLAKPRDAARVGMMYLQKGLRWIPSYRVELDGRGRAKVKLQATLLNELADLEDVVVHLVVGVPSFAFKDTTDPVALQRAAQRLSVYFQQEEGTRHLSNAMMTQVARMGEHPRPEAVDVPELPAAGAKSEDFFIFTLRGLTLRLGEVAVLPVADLELDYADVYALALPMTPPEDVRRHFNHERQRELARLLRAPKVAHRVRLRNTSGLPLTTAPALLVSGGRVLSQAMMTYTPPGGRVDLELAAAVDIPARKVDTEKERHRGALRWRDGTYDRIDLAGKITLTNAKNAPVEVEVSRYVVGEAGILGQGGVAERLNGLEDVESAFADGLPAWWGWHGWPWWWSQLNPITRMRWNVKLEPGKSAELDYGWHYFWN